MITKKEIVKKIVEWNNKRGNPQICEKFFRSPDVQAKVNFEVNWGSYGSVHPEQAKDYAKRLNQASIISKSASGKLTYREFHDLQDEVQDRRYDEYQNRTKGLQFF